MEIKGQLSFLGEIQGELDSAAMKTWYKLNDPAQYEWIDSKDVEDLPDGSEVIIVMVGRDYETGRSMPEKNRYFRTRIRHYSSGRYAVHRLYAEPTQEWPDRPNWQAERDGSQFCWVDHGWMYAYYVRVEVKA